VPHKAFFVHARRGQRQRGHFADIQARRAIIERAVQWALLAANAVGECPRLSIEGSDYG